ncbi:MAG: polyol transport system permease protein [Solirubrobacteraceae bacterium]|jgi:sorbitol/mannitol transport system permease protein|nr:polyol transport system permease protein [Solirubrobacteraceae bacterium]
MTAIPHEIDRGTSNALPKAPSVRKTGWARRAPLLPALIFMVVMTQLPFIATLVISTLSWNALEPGTRKFVFLDNYKTVFTDAALRQAVVNTIVFTASVVVVSVILGLLIAVLLDRKFLGRGLVRTMMIAPFLVVPIAAALIWKHALLNPNYGLFNGVLTWIGRLFGDSTPAQPDWISQMPKTAVVAALVWQWTPFMMLLLLAGLQSQPRDPLEAAKVDGATPWQAFRFVTLPHMRTYIELAVLLGSIYIVQNFDFVFTITSGGLGTANLPYAVYNTFFAGHEYGQASAAGVVVVIGSIVLGTFALRVVSTLFREEVR